MEFIQTYIPTSRAQLLQVAMWYHKGDVDKAQSMVDFYTKNMPNLPEFDPVQPTWMQQAKTGMSDIFSWLKENKDDVLQGYDFIRSIIQNRGALPTIETPATGTPLPNINE